MAMLLDAFDSSSIKTNEDADDELSKQLNKLKLKITKQIDKIKLWFKQKTEGSIAPMNEKNGNFWKFFLSNLSDSKIQKKLK